jgi:hypothetical protein
LTGDAEALIAQFIRSNFLVLGRGSEHPTLKSALSC